MNVRIAEHFAREDHGRHDGTDVRFEQVGAQAGGVTDALSPLSAIVAGCKVVFGDVDFGFLPTRSAPLATTQ